LDKGLATSEKFILHYWKEYLEKSLITKIDSKTQLQEHSLKKYKTLPIYKISNQSGSQHEPVFKAEVQISNSKKYYATGKSKKEAQQKAAKKLLNELKIFL
jgi:ribonuclease-3